MASSFEFCLNVANTGRSLSDVEWEAVDRAHIDLWKQAVSEFRENKLVIREDEFTVSIDWRPMLRRHQRVYSIMSNLVHGHTHTDRPDPKVDDFPTRPSRNHIIVSSKSEKHGLSEGAAETVLHDIFLMMNIAGPASFDLLGATLKSSKSEQPVSLSNVHFDFALEAFLEHGWPTVSVLPLREVVTWFSSIRNSPAQVPSNPMERVIFALLHIAKSDASPMSMIWIFYALESLLQTHAGQNLSSMTNRLSVLLEASPQQSKILKSKLRELYDLRSSIVHGGFEVIHPLHNDVIDSRVNAHFSRLINAEEFGHAILVAAIQKTILRGWRYPVFGESMSGEAIAG